MGLNYQSQKKKKSIDKMISLLKNNPAGQRDSSDTGRAGSK